MEATDFYPVTCALYLEENNCGADSRRKKEAGLYKVNSLTNNTSYKIDDGTFVKECESIESRLWWKSHNRQILMFISLAFPGSLPKHASILFIKKNQKIFGTESPKQAFDLHLEAIIQRSRMLSLVSFQ